MTNSIKNILSILCLCSLSHSASAESQLVKNLTAGKKQTLVTFGTSLTAVGAWVDQIDTALEHAYPGKATVINGAQGGANSDWGVKSLDEKVLAHNPDTVLIEFSVNDSVTRRKTTVEHAQNNLNQLIDRILAHNPKCEVILQVMNVPVANTRTGRANLEAFNQMYRDTAVKRNLQLVDHWPNWQKLLTEEPLRFLSYTPDTIHPVREGALNVITPHLIKELGIPATDRLTESKHTPCWKYMMGTMRDKKTKNITLETYNEFFGKIFKLSDLDADGKLNAEEIQADTLLKALDENQDQAVSLEEWTSAHAPQFQKIDTNNDGVIDSKEKDLFIFVDTKTKAKSKSKPKGKGKAKGKKKSKKAKAHKAKPAPKADPGKSGDLIATDGLSFTKGWQQKDGIISPSEKPGGFLWSKHTYTNFTLTLEYKTSEDCNSGLFFRTNPNDPVQGGFEIQVASTNMYKGKHVVGSLYDAKEAAKIAGKPDGEWNKMSLTCDGSKITVVLNGETVQNLDLQDWKTAKLNPDGSKNKFKTALKDMPHTGHLGLQYHGHPVFYRNINIKNKE